MNEYKISENAAEKVIDSFSNVLVHPVIVARAISKAPGPIKRKIWETIKLVILHWKIEEKFDQYPDSEKDIYNWAKGVKDE